MALKFYAADWRKIRRKRFKPTGMGKLLDKLDMQYREYIKCGRIKFVEAVSGPESAKSDDERFLKGFKEGESEIQKIFKARSADWTEKEKGFIQDVLADYANEVIYWKGKPCTKEYLFEKNLEVKIKGKKERVLEAVRDLEAHAKDYRKRLKVEVIIKPS